MALRSGSSPITASFHRSLNWCSKAINVSWNAAPRMGDG
jgi:hypothetical protein